MLKQITFSIIMAIVPVLLFAQQAPVNLYLNGVPNAKPTPVNYLEKFENGDWISMVSQPTLIPYLPDKNIANGTAVIIFPGGGYMGLSGVKEGSAVAREFVKKGVAAFVLKYRLPNDGIMTDKSIGPLQDAQRAIQLVRQRALEWGVNPAKVGVIGFSAGGHLASTLATHFTKAVIDNQDNVNLRPDFALLIYPVITFGPLAHAGSREALLGKNPSQEITDLYSNEKQVTAGTPPCFLVHAGDDDVVPVQNSLMFYDALLAHKVKAELHLYQAGGHGFGLINPKSKALWFNWAANWLDENGWLTI